MQSTDVAADDQESPAGRSFFRRPRVLLATGLLIGALFAHQQLLAAAFHLMVLDEPGSPCQWAIVANGTPECYEAAASMIRQGDIQSIVIVEAKPSRSIQIGAWPRAGLLVTEELTRRGVEPDRLKLISNNAVTPHQVFQELDKAVSINASDRVMVISTATLSRYHRIVIEQALPSDRWDNYQVRPFTHKTVVADRWWRTRGAIREVLNHGLRLAFVICRGESDVDPHDPYEHLTGDDSRAIESTSPGQVDERPQALDTSAIGKEALSVDE